jgi:hypothetical protein
MQAEDSLGLCQCLGNSIIPIRIVRQFC